MRSRRTLAADFLAVLVCSSAFSGGGWALWKNFTTYLQPAGAEEIGTIIYKRKVAQRKYSDRAIWEELRSNAPLYSYDSVRTAEDSEATLVLKDGTEISLDENTLILLDFDRDNRNIEFLSGNITTTRAEDEAPSSTGIAAAATPPPLTIVSRGSKVEMRDRSLARLSVSEKGSLDVAVSKGTVDLVVAEGKREVKEHEKAVVSEDARTATVERVPLSMTSPAHDSFWLSYGGESRVAFSWRSEPPRASYGLEVSRSSAFESVLRDERFASPEGSLALGPGTYYARAYAETEGGARTRAQAIRFTVIEDRPPAPESPPEGSAYAYRVAPPSSRFSWEPSRAAASHVLEIARDEAFANVVARSPSGGSFTQAAVPGEGRFFWRIVPVYAFKAAGAEPLPSSARSFAVSRMAQIPAAELLSPRDGETIPVKAVEETGLRFSWKPEPESIASVITIARDAAMADTVGVRESRTSALEYGEKLPAGNYWWRVVTRDSEGNESPPSKPSAFSISLAPPVVRLASPAEGAEADAALRFEWEAEGATAFALELSEDEAFGSPIKRETTLPRADLRDLRPGRLWWRVKAIGPRGIELSSSETRSLRILPPLPAPRPLSPEEGEGLDLAGAAAVQFSWSAADGADGYSFRLVGADGKAIREEGSVTGVSYRFTDVEALDPGRYRWEIAAYQTRPDRVRRSETAGAAFAVERNARIRPPELAEPVDGASIGELDLKRAGLSFSWKADPLTPETRFVLARDPGFREILSERATKESRASFRRLEPGEYWWSVSGVGPNGSNYSSAVRRFTVRKAPPLPDPSIVKPARGEKIEMADKDSLSLAWSPVAGATHYSATLTSLKTGETVAVLERTRGTSWEFTDLSRLDVASFSLVVQAFAVGEDGSIERRSGKSAVEFSLKLSTRMGAPEIVSPDVIYLD